MFLQEEEVGASILGQTTCSSASKRNSGSRAKLRRSRSHRSPRSQRCRPTMTMSWTRMSWNGSRCLRKAPARSRHRRRVRLPTILPQELLRRSRPPRTIRRISPSSTWWARRSPTIPALTVPGCRRVSWSERAGQSMSSTSRCAAAWPRSVLRSWSPRGRRRRTRFCELSMSWKSMPGLPPTERRGAGVAAAWARVRKAQVLAARPQQHPPSCRATEGASCEMTSAMILMTAEQEVRK
mmetsp:Transcript_2105/g.4794  ORF Transcript_2105/g.4794 Transcript_2105/m.4794 type:complete len:238 (+) Transcript_2105:445-1158(+)